ncbi:circularly permuted type 2 ATP-grasp protein [Teredinibacter turnerae]|uniref:circularly permuted type 2 ATP-grasp protein n=1 Tax=Teredinibacter turnerae TaxID=2426 RepID=UPI0005F86F1E|nr:circularly permuted type 2 ATP-grasp protein [Teredinibacter turnerae]
MRLIVPTTEPSPLVPPELHYRPSSDTADEVYAADGQPRPHWEYLLESLKSLGPKALAERQQKAQRILRDDGATYNIYGEDVRPGRTWELDLVPALISSEEWGVIESGLLERAELFNAILKDLYGERELIRHGIIPPEALFAHGGFLRACHGITTPGDHELIIHGVDMMRTESGDIYILTDRTQAPSGMGYALENRTVMSRVLPSLFRDSQVHRLATFFQRLRQKLSSLSINHDQPRVVLLTPGAHNETYFEHAYLANYLGFPLVQSGDLVVRNGFVWMRSLDGLSRVDVILRRVDDWYCDPVELRSDSQLGVAGLLEVVRAGRVVIANPLGSGVLENPLLFKYLPAISKSLIGREPRMQSVETYWCGDKQDMKYVLANLKDLVIKPVYRGRGEISINVGELPKAEQETLLARVKAEPSQFVAQPLMRACHLPSFVDKSLQPRPAITRSFAVASDTSYTLMPGGLTRLGIVENGFLIAGQAGSQSKDTWVIASEPERASSQEKLAESSGSASENQLLSLPSRVVENLFWMGRYAERAEASLRILRTVFLKLNGEEPISTVSRRHLLEAVTGITATLPGFKDCEPELIDHPDEELLLVAKAPFRLGSVYHTLTCMLQSADESKELLSSDTLRVINDIRDALDNLESALTGGLSAAPEEALDPLVTALMALSGLWQESMVRGVGWQFMNIGRRIERAMQTTCAMQHLLVPVLAENEQTTLMESLLISVEALISYRRRYRARMGISQVLELVMLDTSNPRSLLYQLDQLKNHLSSLPMAKNMVELSPEQRLILEAETSARLSLLSELAADGEEEREKLSALLSKLAELLGTLSNVISDKYFDHRIGPQQLVHNTWDNRS